MAIAITVPRLGWSAEEATFACWLKNDGENVAVGDALLSLEGDKSLQEIESMDAGILRLLPNSPQTNDVVKVGQLIAYLVAEGEPLPVVDASPAPSAPAAVASVATDPVPVPLLEAPPSDRASTPRAKRVSVELGVEIALLRGSGKDGRIRERDVRTAAKAAVANSGIPDASSASRELAVTPMRRTIADRMMQSLAQTAPVTLTSRVDATNLVALRNQFKASKSEAPVPAYTDVVAKLVASTLARFPAIMGQWRDAKISLPNEINIGIAVDTEYGLIVPVVPDVPKLSLAELTRVSRRLIENAQARKLKVSDLTGGVFTITNLGGFGIDGFTPIINLPETAILGLGAIRREPVVGPAGNITVRDQMMLSLTFDHRVLDGAPAARFLQALAQAIENPVVWLIDNPAPAAKK